MGKPSIQTPIKKAVILTIGRGTRSLSVTQIQPQEMMSIIDKPAIQYVVEEAIQSGIQEILIITRGTGASFETLFDKDFGEEMMSQQKSDATLTSKGMPDVKIYLAYQTEFNGLRHAILYARQFIDDEPFAVLCSNEVIDASVPSLKQLLDIYPYYPGTILGVQEIERSKVANFDIVKPLALNDRISRVLNLLHKPSASKAPSRLAIFGRYIFDPEVFSILEKMTSGHRRQILLTDALRQLALTKPVYAYQLEGRCYDVGDKQGYLEATLEFALKRSDTRDQFCQYMRQSILPILLK
jgi:UTP--glucose-1-phosphate uridylyltransferase